MVDGLIAGIGFEARLRSIGHGVRPIDQHMIPGLVAVGLSPVAVVPLAIRPAVQVKVHDDPAILIAPVADQLSDQKARRFVLEILCGLRV